MPHYSQDMNKGIIIAAIAAAIAIGIGIGVAGTVGNPSASSETNSPAPAGQNTANQNPLQRLEGSVSIDGSSTVYPITEVIAEDFSKNNPDVKTTVAVSGTGGGFKRFVVGETDINDSSRPITQKEIDSAVTSSVRWVEIPIALEGLTIVVNPDNNIIPNSCISIEELKAMWQPERTATLWSDLDGSYPSEPILLYGAGPDSGTFDYFTERVVGTARSSTTDYIPSEDDNVLVQGVANDRYSLGYIPLAYVEEAGDRLKILSVSETKGGECVLPNSEDIISGKYPLARPLFIHVNYDKLQERPELQAFVEYYLTNAKDATARVGYVPLSDDYYPAALAALTSKQYSADDQETFNSIYK
ncbi:MAG TPA: PstS family phosphate ABC transporter substrate-binding protein [Nitrososphaera sp.]|nr:PstS family phosphate ABC transporter substrate-binding protein [Nitrososphaera sp.]